MVTWQSWYPFHKPCIKGGKKQKVACGTCYPSIHAGSKSPSHTAHARVYHTRTRPRTDTHTHTLSFSLQSSYFLPYGDSYSKNILENTFYSEHILYESTHTHLSFSLRCRAQVIFRVNDTHIRFLSLFLGQTSSHLPSGRVRNTLGAHKEHIRNTHYSELKLFTLWAFSLEVCWCYLVSLPQCLAAGLSVMCALSVENTFYR